MKLIPDDNWRWYFDNEAQRLMLDLANGEIFRSRYPVSMLTPDAFIDSAFCVDDAALFFTYQEKCQHMDIGHQARAELVLNALVANRFLKPLMPKSWHFSALHNDGYCPAIGELVQAQLNGTRNKARFLVVDAGEKASLCLLAQPEVELSGKTLQLADAIKIMHDRLLPDAGDAAAPRYAFAG